MNLGGGGKVCGIAGVTASTHDARLAVKRMLDPIRHRGPDGEGVVSAGGVTLGHRRLSILDLGAQAAQPMVRGDVALSFNGEIYNYVELREELVSLGHRFHTSSDSEVLLVSYLEWGQACVEHFDGMWAFAIHDRRNQTLLLSRDRFGEKPLLLGTSDGQLYFASEHRQLRVLGIGTEPNLNTVLEYLALGRQCSPVATYFDGIEALPPATNLLVDVATGHVSRSTYYRATEGNAFTGIADDEIQTALEHEMRRSVRARLRSDVPVGCLLSGGVDSSLLVALASEIYGEETGRALPVFTAVSSDRRNDESVYARMVAQQCNVEWHTLKVDPIRSQSAWEPATAILEQPTSSSVAMQMQVFAAAKQRGLTVILDGQGADEVWQGYERYAYCAINELPRSSRSKFIRQSAASQGVSSRSWMLGYLYFSYPGLAAERNLRRMRRLGLDVSRTWLSTRLDMTHNTRRRTSNQLLVDELGGEQLVSLLRYMDRVSMASSVEGRVPYLDHRLVELSSRAATRTRFRDGWSKHPLRRMLSKYVGPTVAYRRGKIGFDGPRDVFDVRDPYVQHEVSSSPLLREMQLSSVDLSAIQREVAWRLFALALWDRVVLREHRSAISQASIA